MTACVAVKVHDCIAFAADSAVSTMAATAGGAPIVSNVWKHGMKVFSLHRRLPIMAMTAGIGNSGLMSINSLAKDLRIVLTDNLEGRATRQEALRTLRNVISKMNTQRSTRLQRVHHPSNFGSEDTALAQIMVKSGR